MTSGVYMVYAKVVDLNVIYNFVVNKFLFDII